MYYSYSREKSGIVRQFPFLSAVQFIVETRQTVNVCYIIAPFPRAGHHGGEANSESTHLPGIFSHRSPYKYNYKRAIRITDTRCWCRIFQLILKYYLFIFL